MSQICCRAVARLASFHLLSLSLLFSLAVLSYPRYSLTHTTPPPRSGKDSFFPRVCPWFCKIIWQNHDPQFHLLLRALFSPYQCICSPCFSALLYTCYLVPLPSTRLRISVRSLHFVSGTKLRRRIVQHWDSERRITHGTGG